MIVAAHQTMMGPPALPYAKEVQYLVFDGTQCVETAAPTNTMKLRVVYNGDYIANGEANVIGLYDNLSGTANRVYIGPQATNVRCLLVSTEYNISQAARNVLAEQIADIPNRKHTLIKNGTTYTATIGNFGTYVAQSPIGIGSRNWFSTNSPYHKIEMPFSGKVYIFERWDSGIQTAKYIPVVDLDGVACFYDEIGGSLHYPWTGNPLVAGPDKT